MTSDPLERLRQQLVAAADRQATETDGSAARARRRRNLGWLVGALVVLVPAGAAATGVVSTGLFDASPRELARGVQADQAAAFGLFARARVAEDVVPEGAASMIGDSALSGRNLSLSRAISTPTGRGWAFPGNKTVCLAVPDPVDGFGVTCVNTSFAVSWGVAAMLASPDHAGDVDLTLLVPDGGQAVARFEDGSSRVLNADADGVVAERLTNATALEVVSPSGQRRTMAMPVPPPSKDAYVDCGNDRVVPAKQGCEAG